MTKSLPLPDAKRDHVSGSANGSIKLLEYGDMSARSALTPNRSSKRSRDD